jgi:two-component system, chemotaxis family, protein-glutamate methylesterase/glutaminase
MPLNAIQTGVIDHQVGALEVGGLLKQLADREFEEREMEPDARMQLENRIAMARRFSTDIDADPLGPPSGYTCPDCNGGLIAVSEGNYRCHVGHAWTADALLHARDDEIESALWIAIRSLQEKAKLSRRLADQVTPGILSDRYEMIANEAEHAMTVLGHRLSDAYTRSRSSDG